MLSKNFHRLFWYKDLLTTQQVNHEQLKVIKSKTCHRMFAKYHDLADCDEVQGDQTS